MAEHSDYELSEHALIMIREREISIEWIEKVFYNPDITENDRNDTALLHALGKISEHGDRVLRVIYNDVIKPRKIVTVYFDRKMKGKL